MEKQHYKDIKNLDKLTSKNCAFDYKNSEFKNLKNYLKFLHLKQNEIYNKKLLRHQNSPHLDTPLDTPKNRLMKLKIKILAGKIQSSRLNVYNNGIMINNNKEFFFTKNYDYDYDYYAKSYGHPKKITTGIFTFNFADLKLCQKSYWIIDDILNIKIRSLRKHQDTTYIIADCALKTTGDNYKIKKLYIVIFNGFAYHSEKSIKNAYKKLLEKIEKNKKNLKICITAETPITIELYHTVTGACFPGIKNYMEIYNLKEGENKDIIKNLLEYKPFGSTIFLSKIA